ncbi:MFS transporter [Lysinibacillus sp. NPDC056959]|uniref:MFS transporter n=1 Tax=Lysinibacillus sp. NPDC056959 TaxID=3345981 RepID=UPI003635F079
MNKVATIENNGRKNNYNFITLILFWCGLVVVSSLYLTIPLVSIFADNFNETTATAAWTGSVFSLCYAIGLLIFGHLSDRLDRKQIILLGLICLTIISPILGTVETLTFLIVLRGMQGFLAATFAPVALAYIVDVFPEERRVTATGFVASGFLMAGIIGQVFSSLVSQWLGWQSVFYILGGVYFLTAILVAVLIPKGERTNKNENLMSTMHQLKTIFTNIYLIYCYIITVTLLLSFVGMYTVLGNYLTTNFNLDDNQILSVRAVGIFGMLLSPFSGKLVEKFGIYNVIRSGLLLAVIGLTILGISSNLAFLVIMSVVFVAGISMTVPSLITVVGQLGGQSRGMAVALYTFILFIGATLAPIIAMSLLKTGNYFLTFETFAVLIGIGLFVSFFIKPKKIRY